MIKFSVKIQKPSDFVVKVAEELQDRRKLNAALGNRVEDELRDHFILRNSQPNKRNWKKQNWWAGVADATGLDEVTNDHAVVKVAHSEGFALRVNGGTIVPREKKALTIPLVEEAYGKSVDEYERGSGRRLFRPSGSSILAYGDENSLTPVYYLARRVQIDKDEHALPAPEQIRAALREEVADYMDRI